MAADDLGLSTVPASLIVASIFYRAFYFAS